MSAMFKSMTVRIVDGLVLTMKRVKIVGAAGTIHIPKQSTAFTQQVSKDNVDSRWFALIYSRHNLNI